MRHTPTPVVAVAGGYPIIDCDLRVVISRHSQEDGCELSPDANFRPYVAGGGYAGRRVVPQESNSCEFDAVPGGCCEDNPELRVQQALLPHETWIFRVQKY